MTESIIRTKWINLRSLSGDNFQILTKITSISAHEFIISTRDTSWDTSNDNKQLFKYNIDTNTFNEFIISIDDNNWHCTNMDFNDKEQLLYIQNGNKIISINMTTNNSTSLLDRP
eukprot:430626_1